MKLIILDRDGVINYDSDDYIKTPEEWRPLPGSLEAITKLNRAGYHVVVLTNQAGIARGYFTLATLQKIHQKLLQSVEAAGGNIDKIYFCPHGNEDQCDCRKPKPGMFKQIENDFKISLKEVYYIGDKYSDLQAAIAAGCKFILVKTGYGKRVLEKYPELSKTVTIADNLAAAISNHVI